MNIKNQVDAEEKAKSLWGPTGFAFSMGMNKFIVGEINGPFRQSYGEGNSWDKAFESAKLNIN